jgi:hypothetical protein
MVYVRKITALLLKVNRSVFVPYNHRRSLLMGCTSQQRNSVFYYMHWRNIIILYYWYNTCILLIECMPCTYKKERDCIGIVCCSIPFICSCEYNMFKTNKTEIVCMPDIHVVCCVRSYNTLRGIKNKSRY